MILSFIYPSLIISFVSSDHHPLILLFGDILSVQPVEGVDKSDESNNKYEEYKDNSNNSKSFIRLKPQSFE